MTIIEVDGINVQPLAVDSIRIYAGQRYSFVLDAKQQTGNYWIRADQHKGLDGGPTGFEGGINSAILRYADSPEIDPTFAYRESIMPLVETDLHPLESPGAPGRPHVGGADVNLVLNMVSTADDLGYLINNVKYEPPPVPVLLQILSGAKKGSDLLPKGSVYYLPPNKVIEVSLPAYGAKGGPVSIYVTPPPQ